MKRRLAGAGLSASVVFALSVGCAHREPTAILALPSDELRGRLLPDLDIEPSRRPNPRDEVDAVVVLSYDLHPDGSVAEARTVYALPSEFEQRAVAELSSWRFRPVPSQRSGRKIRLTYRGPPDAVQVSAAVPAPGDCDAGTWAHASGRRRWAVVSCSPGLLREVAVEGLVGWRSLYRQRLTLD